MKKFNFPIKYTLQPLHGFIYETEHYKTESYIVTKCYVVEDIVRYSEDGTIKNIHKVVLPYQDFPYSKKRNYPTYDINTGSYNVREVEHLYDSLEEAKEVCDFLNMKCFEEIAVANTSRVSNFIDLVEERFNLLDEEENRLLESTNDMEVSYENRYKNKTM